MSLFGVERTQTFAGNNYDHAINLVDTTKPREISLERRSQDSSEPDPCRSDSGPRLSKQWTKTGTLRQQLAQRKYAKYQEDATETSRSEEGGGRQNNERTSRLRDKIPFKARKKAAKSTEKADTFIDVLYENQRGSFFCGIPLYSSNSLLNFDPAAWQTANFQDSAVNITNFQLPDPSWAWDWKTWYVDMSHDVDEEGWEYSFSFNNFYSWHGNHPWFTSFTRRRRWLRRRVRIRPHLVDGKKRSMSQAHMLTEDYFTIHAANKRPSRESSGDRTTTHGSSYMNGWKGGSEDEEETGEINNVAALMAALKKARVDREKIAAVTAFLYQGGDELYYLADSMPTIMDDFIHQTSRCQLQTCLLQALDKATSDRGQAEAKGKGKVGSDPEIDARTRMIDNLIKAIHSAGVHVNDMDYWNDLRARVTSSETDPTNQTHALDATEGVEITGHGPHSHSGYDEPSVREEIKGIPKNAHVSEEPRIRIHTRTDEEAPQEKGKGKA
ncbi:hypothetical protein N7G274_001972 [Stereocaulon virgatum]|uniref:TECPR1-like DysF domain-containing protein n=1 Tax=Stereocaulon virgatum TaxID=373712 RepID=A0ABR4ALJ5_9LECA